MVKSGDRKRQPHGLQTGEIKLHLPFHPRARRNDTRCRNALHHTRGVAFSRNATRDDGTLGNGINLTIRSGQRCHDQSAAQQTFCIPNRRDGDVNLPARTCKGGQCRGDEYRCDVLGPILLTRHVDTQSFQQVRHDFFGKGRIAQAVTRAVQPNDKPITYKIIAAHPVEFDQILDADGASGCRQCETQEYEYHSDHLRKSVRLRRDSRAVME